MNASFYSFSNLLSIVYGAAVFLLSPFHSSPVRLFFDPCSLLVGYVEESWPPASSTQRNIRTTVLNTGEIDGVRKDGIGKCFT